MKNDMKNSLKNNLYLIKIIWSASPARIIGEFLYILGESAFWLVYTLFGMRFLINCIENGTGFPLVAAVIGGFFAVSLGTRLFGTYVTRSLRRKTNVKIQEKMMDIIYRQALRVDMDCYEDAEFYDRYTRANEEIANRTEEILSVFSDMAAIILQFLGYGIAVLSYDPFIIPFLVIALVLSKFLQGRFVYYRVKRENEAVYQRRRMEYAKRVVYLQDYAKDLRLTNMFRPIMNNFHRAADEAVAIAGYYGKRAGIFRTLTTIVSGLTVDLGINAFVLYRYLVAHAYNLGVFTTILNASNGLNDCLGGLVRIWGQIKENGIFIENYRRFVEYEPTMKEKPDAKTVSDGPHEIGLSHVGFHYRGSDKMVLTDITMNIKPGQKIALVGHNGAGKSTLVKLLMRLYDVTGGSITLDGADIRDLRIEEYRRQFGTVFQDFKVFAASVTENVLLRPAGEGGTKEEDAEAVRAALKDSGVWEKVESLPHGPDTILTKEFEEDGALLSGGEQQKMAVARVFAGKSSIAILDEPSSALDPISEYELFNNMMAACEGKTVIFVSHRLSSAVLADKVYLLEQGRIIEQGSHHELMQAGGKYAEMFHMQAKNYKEEQKYSAPENGGPNEHV